MIFSYKRTAYYKITKNSYMTMRMDSGMYGEYLTYDRLHFLEKRGARFLFNCYMEKNNGEKSEIDIIVICSLGILVIESKNYSGSIYGDLYSSEWVQIFSGGEEGRKEYFYNPMKQNRSHIKSLKKVIPDDIPVYSILCFSDRCKLNVDDVEKYGIYVTKRHDIKVLYKYLRRLNGECLSRDEIDEIYDKLYPYSQIYDPQKKRHIKEVSKRERRFGGVDGNKCHTAYAEHHFEENMNNLICRFS